MTPALADRPRAARLALLGAAALLSLGAALASASPARAASCDGTLSSSGAFVFSCNTSLGSQGTSSFLFSLTGTAGKTTMTGASVSSPAGITCTPIAINQRCFGSNRVPAGTVLSGTATRAEGAFCGSVNDPAPDVFTFTPGSALASYAGGLRCPSMVPVPPQGKPKPKPKRPSASGPKSRCQKQKPKRKRRKCSRGGKSPGLVPA